MKAATIDVAQIRRAVASVSDPEFPGVSIEELGIVEAVSAEGDAVRVDLVPTFLGCPALDMIRGDVVRAVSTVPGVTAVDVRFVDTPVWTPDRVTPEGRAKLAGEFTVAIRVDAEVTCPVCGTAGVVERSPFGPTACRAIAYCETCRNPVEVMRR